MKEYAKALDPDWNYTNKKLLFVQIHGMPVSDPVGFYDDEGRLWLTLNKNGLFIEAGYSWDGCTGVPDKDEAMLACFVHDALCQFKNAEQMPLTKRQIDEIFYLIMKASGFCGAWLYWAGVRMMGGLF